MDPVELARRVAEVLRGRGQITDEQLQIAARHFGAGEDPVRCLELAGVAPAHLDAALAVLGVGGATAPTQMLGSIPGDTSKPPETPGSATSRSSQPPSTMVMMAEAAPGEGSRRIEAMPTIGEWLGQWRVVRRLGEGGMATVSLAEDAKGRKAAVKVVHPHLLRMPELRARFLREIAATGKVQHRNVVGVLDMSASADDQAWLAVEYVDGGNVAELLRSHGRLPLAAAVEIFAQLLEGLEAAHALGIVHRDLKPENLLLTRDGVLKIADFGIARELDATQMTQTGSTLGTPSYMSPEQARAEPVDPRSDLYTTGVILYELLTGKNPFLADSIGATVANILIGRVQPLFEIEPTVPEPIDELVSALLRGDARARPQSASVMRQALAPFIDDTRATRPRLLADLLTDPGVATSLRREQAHSLVGAARQLLQMGPHQREAAGLCLMRARLLDDENADAMRLLQGLATEGVSFASTTTPKIVEVEQQLASNPEDPVLLQRAGQLWRQEGNVYKAAVYFRRYLKVRPDDQYVQGQLSRITMVAGSTVERIAGHVQTSLGVASAVPIERPGPETSVRPPSGEEIVQPLGERLVAALGMNASKLIAGGIVAALLVVGVPWLKGLTARRSIDDTRGGGMVRPGQPDEDMAAKDLDETRAAFQQGRWDDAIKAAGAVLDHTSKPSRASEALVLRGRARMSANKQLSAVEDFSRVVNAYADTDRAAEALVWRGKAYAESGDQDAALADFTRALGKSLTQPLQVMARVERGVILAQRGDVEGARKDLSWVDNYTSPSDAAHARAREALRALP